VRSEIEDKPTIKPMLLVEEWAQVKRIAKNARPDKKVRKLIKKARQSRQRVYNY